jgi:hypothetical protein
MTILAAFAGLTAGLSALAMRGARKDRPSLARLFVCEGCRDAATARWAKANPHVARSLGVSCDADGQPQTGSRGGVRGEASVAAQGVLI